MTLYFSPAPKPISPPKPQKLTVKKQNKARFAENFKRTLHSRARQKFVNLMPCAACGVWGFSVNAHLLGNDGGSRKGHYTTVGPLCGPRPGDGGKVYEGCHFWYDEKQEEFRKMFPTFNAKKVARSTQAKWKAFCQEAA